MSKSLCVTPSLDLAGTMKIGMTAFPLEISYVRPLPEILWQKRRCRLVPGSLIGITPQNPQVGEADVLLMTFAAG